MPWHGEGRRAWRVREEGGGRAPTLLSAAHYLSATPSNRVARHQLRRAVRAKDRATSKRVNHKAQAAVRGRYQQVRRRIQALQWSGGVGMDARPWVGEGEAQPRCWCELGASAGRRVCR